MVIEKAAGGRCCDKDEVDRIMAENRMTVGRIRHRINGTIMSYLSGVMVDHTLEMWMLS